MSKVLVVDGDRAARDALVTCLEFAGMEAHGAETAVAAQCWLATEVADVLVVADDVNLPLGRLRARPGGSAGGHNGFKSVAQHLATDQFPRLRVGVGRGDDRRDLADHVLARFDPDERPVIEEAIGRAADAVDVFGREGIAVVMNRFNAGPKELSEIADDEKDSQS